MVSEIMSGMVLGVEGELIKVQMDISPGLPVFNMIGYLSNEVKEAKERVRTALKNCGYVIPPRRIAVNLAPADIRKFGTFFDLAIATAFLISMGIGDFPDLSDTIFLGELSLDGSLCPLPGVLPILMRAREMGYRRCLVPADNGEEASLVEGMEVLGLDHLVQVEEFLEGVIPERTFCLPPPGDTVNPGPDFAEIKGQKDGRRALEIAAAGFHNVFLTGPPGMGKSLLASGMPGIMPDMTMEEKIETTMIYSAKGLLKDGFSLIRNRPFRSPSHSVTQAGLLGGGLIPKPGEISLAHHGVLFLDELPEYPRNLIEMLRLPLENHSINLARQERSLTFPADFIMISAANPCPCGFYPDRDKCNCTDRQIQRYQSRVSGPIMDRMDLFVHCEEVGYDLLVDSGKAESSAAIRKRVEEALERQKARFGKNTGYYNGRMSPSQIQKYCRLDSQGKSMMKKVYNTLRLTGRAYYKVLKVARTIADLDGSESIREDHLVEAVHYRNVKV